MNQYPLWRYLLLVVVIGVGILYALPNVFGDDPSLQVSARRGAAVDEALETRVTTALAEAGAVVKRSELGAGRLLLRFDDEATRARAREAIAAVASDEQYIVALNRASAMPDWLPRPPDTERQRRRPAGQRRRPPRPPGPHSPDS